MAGPNRSAPIEKSELALAVKDLAFEFYYFQLYSDLNKSSAFAILSPAVSRAVGYSLLIHFRVLLDFFYLTPKKDDCCVTTFATLSPEFKANFAPVAPPSWLKEVRDNLHKRLAHMTATRWREKPSVNYYNKYFGEVFHQMEAFINALPSDLRSGFDKSWNELEARNKTPPSPTNPNGHRGTPCTPLRTE